MNKNRRKEIEDVKDQIEEIKSSIESIRDEEQDCYEILPEGIQDGERGEAMLNAVDNLETAIDNLDDAINNLTEAAA